MTDARDKALARVTAKSSPASAPVIDQGTVEAFLDAAGMIDGQGRYPGSDSWDGPWDENLAIAEVWSCKAAAVAGNFDFSADGASYNKGDLLAKFLELEQQYRARAGAGGGIGTTTARSSTIGLADLDSIAARVLP